MGNKFRLSAADFICLQLLDMPQFFGICGESTRPSPLCVTECLAPESKNIPTLDQTNLARLQPMLLGMRGNSPCYVLYIEGRMPPQTGGGIVQQMLTIHLWIIHSQSQCKMRVNSLLSCIVFVVQCPLKPQGA